LKFQDSEPPLGFSSEFVTPFQATLIIGPSQSKLSIKSYGCLKFFRPQMFATQKQISNYF